MRFQSETVFKFLRRSVDGLETRVTSVCFNPGIGLAKSSLKDSKGFRFLLSNQKLRMNFGKVVSWVCDRQSCFEEEEENRDLTKQHEHFPTIFSQPAV